MFSTLLGLKEKCRIAAEGGLVNVGVVRLQVGLLKPGD